MHRFLYYYAAHYTLLYLCPFVDLSFKYLRTQTVRLDNDGEGREDKAASHTELKVVVTPYTDSKPWAV